MQRNGTTHRVGRKEEESVLCVTIKKQPPSLQELLYSSSSYHLRALKNVLLRLLDSHVKTLAGWWNQHLKHVRLSQDPVLKPHTSRFGKRQTNI